MYCRVSTVHSTVQYFPVLLYIFVHSLLMKYRVEQSLPTNSCKGATLIIRMCEKCIFCWSLDSQPPKSAPDLQASVCHTSQDTTGEMASAVCQCLGQTLLFCPDFT